MDWTLVESSVDSPGVKTLRFKPARPVNFAAGQYFVLHDTVNNIEDCRAYSSSSPPGQETIEITVKLTRTPHFSKHLHELAPGYTIEARGPYGQFTLDPSLREIVLIGAGSGIAPLRSILLHALSRGIKATLICSAKTQETVIFCEELEQLAKENKIQLFITLTQTAGKYHGRISKELLLQAVPHISTVSTFLCGPPLMVKNTLALLAELSVKKVHSEAF